jgi:hypothetical protein
MQHKLHKRDEVLLLSPTNEVRSKTQAESKYLEDIVSLMKKLQLDLASILCKVEVYSLNSPSSSSSSSEKQSASS